MKSTEQIIKVETALKQWREQDSSKNGIIPKEIKKQAVQLMSHYTQSEITSRLNIRATALSQWAKLYPSTEQDPSMSFIPLPLTNNDSPSTLLNVSAQFANGHSLSMSGDISPLLLQTLLQELRQ